MRLFRLLSLSDIASRRCAKPKQLSPEESERLGTFIREKRQAMTREQAQHAGSEGGSTCESIRDTVSQALKVGRLCDEFGSGSLFWLKDHLTQTL